MGLTPFKKELIGRAGPAQMWPTTAYRRLRYSEPIQLDLGGTGTYGSYVFRANQLHDPNVSGTGHQPQGYDVLSAAYNYYEVLGCKIKITGAWKAAPTAPVNIGLAVRNYSTILTLFGASAPTYSHILEHGDTSHKLIPNDLNAKVNLTYKVNPRKFLNLSPNVSNQTIFGNNDPPYPVYIFFWMQVAGADTADIGPFYGTVQLDYFIRINSPIEQGDN